MTLDEYIRHNILPRYDAFDAAHQRPHVESVISRAMQLAKHYPNVRPDMVLAAAAYHDLGLSEGREHHHLASGRIVRSDTQLREWFTADEIGQIAQAAEDHRASSPAPPRSLLGCIIAEADRQIDVTTVLRRCLQYGLAHYPQLQPERQIPRAREHLTEKYGEGGYLHLLLPDSPNAEPLRELRELLRQPQRLEAMLAGVLEELTRG